jgi:hypothetical protein
MESTPNKVRTTQEVIDLINEKIDSLLSDGTPESYGVLITWRQIKGRYEKRLAEEDNAQH